MKHLSGVVLLVCLIFMSMSLVAAEKERLFDLSGSISSLDPELKRTDVVIPRVDTEDFEFGVFVGALNVENFGTNLLYGANFSFHVTSSFFIRGSAGYSSVTDETFRKMNLPLFGESKTRNVVQYDALLGWNILPGEAYWGDHKTLTTNLYLLAGAGTINFDDEDNYLFTLGLGYKLLITDWLAMALETKTSEYSASILGYESFSHNVDYTAILSVFF